MKNGNAIFLLSLFLTASLILIFGFYSYYSREIDIKYPRIGNPAILEVNSMQGDSLQIKIQAPIGVDLEKVTFLIQNEKKSYDLSASFINYFNEIAIYSLDFPLETDFKEGLYDLFVNIDGLSTFEPHAIQILKNIPSSFSFIIIADVHVNPDVPKYQAQLKKVLEEINLINPNFVLCIGDIADLARRIEWEIFYDMVLDLKVPLYIIEGNHDMGDLNVYYELFSDLYFSFDYGGSHFIGFNSGDKFSNPMGTYVQLDRLESELKEHQNYLQNYIFVHIPPHDGQEFEYPNSNFKEIFFNLCDLYDVDAVFSGHIHEDEIFDRNRNLITNFDDPETRSKTNYIVTTTTAKTETPGYRMVFVEGEKGIVKCSYDINHDNKQDEIDSIPYNKLNSTCLNNDGTQNNLELVIENDLYQTFFDATHEFRVSKDNSSNYIVNGGTIEQISELDSCYLISTSFNIPAMSTTTITIKERVL